MSSTIRRKALVVGVANKRSLAWHSALALLHKNFDVILTYQNERFEPTVGKMVQSFIDQQENLSHLEKQQLPKLAYHPCDVSSDKDIKHLFSTLIPQTYEETFQDTKESIQLDALIHSVAYAPTESMKPSSLLSTQSSISSKKNLSLLETTRNDFQTTHNISSYSLITLSNHALPYLNPNKASITALTYLGSTRAIPNYNIMGPAKASLEAIVRGLALELGPPPLGIRVNAVSAGPVSTLAARGIQDFSSMKQNVIDRSPLQRNITGEEVGDVVAYLAGGKDGSSAITGQTIYVDGGYSII